VSIDCGAVAIIYHILDHIISDIISRDVDNIAGSVRHTRNTNIFWPYFTGSIAAIFAIAGADAASAISKSNLVCKLNQSCADVPIALARRGVGGDAAGLGRDALDPRAGHTLY
jgi:hypothetical protein